MPDSYIEKALLKIAKQINAFDEASLMDLWEKYAEKVRTFEPTKRWEEAAIIFGLVQGMRLKNQLFNYHWAQSRRPEQPVELDMASLTAPEKGRPQPEPAPDPEKDSGAGGAGKRGKLIQLDPGKKR